MRHPRDPFQRSVARLLETRAALRATQQHLDAAAYQVGQALMQMVWKAQAMETILYLQCEEAYDLDNTIRYADFIRSGDQPCGVYPNRAACQSFASDIVLGPLKEMTEALRTLCETADKTVQSLEKLPLDEKAGQ